MTISITTLAILMAVAAIELAGLISLPVILMMWEDRS